MKPPDDLHEGERRRDVGIELTAIANAEFLVRARAFARTFAEQNGIVDINDVRAACEAAGIRPNHHNAWGAVFKDKSSWEIVERAGAQTHNPAGHGRTVSTWRLVQ